MKMDMSRYGGPVYTGAPALAVTASLVQAGGGPGDFSIATALTSMVGPTLVTAEVGKLTKQYGKARVGSWITVFNFAVGDALKKATAAGVTLPDGDLSGQGPGGDTGEGRSGQAGHVLHRVPARQGRHAQHPHGRHGRH